MTRKEQVLRMVEELPEDVSFDDVVNRLLVLRKVEIGLQQADAGDVMDHQQVIEEFQRDRQS